MRRQPEGKRPIDWGSAKEPIVVLYFILIVVTLVLIRVAFPP